MPTLKAPDAARHSTLSALSNAKPVSTFAENALAHHDPAPQDETRPVFAEPWQAQAFALATHLNERGVFTWSEWSQTLGAQLKTDDQLGYYEHWLAALEALVAQKGLCAPSEMAARAEAWHHAFEQTPHGQPVNLK